MPWQSTPWADPLLLSTVIAATLAVFGFLYVVFVRHDRRVIAFATVMVGTAVWTLGYSFQFASADLAGKRLWRTVGLVGEAIVPVAWGTFALVYARKEEWLTRTRVAVLWAIPAVTVLLVVTNAAHGLVWESLSLSTAGDGGYAILTETPGPWLVVHGGYSYFVAFLGVVLMAGLIERSRRVYRGQAAVLLVGILVPAGAHLATLAGIGPASVVDLTPPSMAILGIAFSIGIFRYRLFDLVPVARSSVVENMNEGYIVVDEADDIVDLNVAARSLLGGDEGRLLGRNVQRAFDADLSALQSFDGETTTRTITVGDPPDQQYIDLTVSAIRADRVAGRLVVVRDVTDRIRIERRFQRLIEASSDMVFVLDQEGCVDYASPSVEGVLGFATDDLVGERFFETVVIDDGEDESAPAIEDESLPTAAATWRRVLEGFDEDPASTDQVRFEVRVRTASGTPRTIEAIARYLVDDPAVEGIVINARDVTERKQRETELKRTNERLDQFVSFVSHDLRNPLNVAMGHLDIAIETGREESLQSVREQHERMETMIEDLLSMAREGKDVEETDEVDLREAATRAWGSVQTRGADLSVDTDATILADESRLSNLLENLFRNAVEHAPGEADPSTLTVRVESLPDGFAVADDGVGIPPDIRQEVTDSGYTTESGNTGYGLAIVTEIASAHGWSTAVTESESGGARFEFTGVETADDTRSDGEPTAVTSGEGSPGESDRDGGDAGEDGGVADGGVDGSQSPPADRTTREGGS